MASHPLRHSHRVTSSAGDRTPTRSTRDDTPEPEVPSQSSASLSYELLRYSDRCLPEIIYRQLMRIGAWVALTVMPRQRMHSREYLTVVLGRPARLMDIWRHFYAYTEMFVLRSRLAEGRSHRCQPLPTCDDLKPLLTSQRPALLGTFHFGNSDLLGFLLSMFGGHVHMIRLRMENSRDTHRLATRFGQSVTFIWVNDTSNLLFAVKQAAQSGWSLAMKCDRAEHSSKVEPFEFLGERRLFPFTIYHLAILFNLPVAFCVGVPAGQDASVLHGTPIFEPNEISKAENLDRARAHFQAALHQLESLVRANPFLWFNFIPLPAVAPAGPCPTRQPVNAAV